MDLHFNVSVSKVRKNWSGKAAASVLQCRWISSSLLCCWAVGWILIILSRNMHWKAKSLHIAQQEKHSTIRGHHCCVQREAEYLLQLKNWMFAVPCGESVLTVVSILLSVPMACTALAKTSSKLCLGSTWASALGLSRDYWIEMSFS